jgi:tetratricopeptide (TPR) repeat protein
MSRSLSYKPINFDRWTSLAEATVGDQIAAADAALIAVRRMQLAWTRLGNDLDSLFLPSGPNGSHAYHHFHAPPDPEERQAALDSCALDYETALIYLAVALQMTTRLVSGASGWSFQNWTTLVRAAERGDPGIAVDANPTILYLARTALHARHRAVIHPHEHISAVGFDNSGNVTFRRMVPYPDRTLLAELDALLHEVRPEVMKSIKVGVEVPPDLALTWIGTVASSVQDLERLNYLRENLGFSLPPPFEVAQAVDLMVEAFIRALPPNDFRRMAFCADPASRPIPEKEEVAAPMQPDDPSELQGIFDQACDAGNEGRHQEAADGFAQAIELNPDSSLAHFNLAESLVNLDRPKEAVEHLQQALAIGPAIAEIRPTLILAHFNAGAAAYAKGRFGEAAANYRRVCELDRDDTDARSRLAESLARAGRIDAALLQAAILDRRPGTGEIARVQLAIGVVLRDAGQLEQSKQRFERAVQLEPESDLTKALRQGVTQAIEGPRPEE